jgi:DNA-binding CsgD family transcriptional regulator/tetratricopeptide (TPR) repeat protein
MNEALERGRAGFTARAWSQAWSSLSEADAQEPLAAADLELLATAAFMLGRMDDFFAVLERAYARWLSGGEVHRAVRCAFYVGMSLATTGELARAGGWFGRGQRLVDTAGVDCVEQGYLLMPGAFRREWEGDVEGAFDAASRAAEFAQRFDDADLFALATQTCGAALIRSGRVEDGLGLLDEAMLPATAGDLSPIAAGVVYCGSIAACEEAFDVRRAREWTEALANWCAAQPDLVAFSGRCRVHRAGVMQLDGAWPDALAEAELGRERSERARNAGATGAAFYQQGEVLRLRGEIPAAERAYRDAIRFGHEPQPGLALLRLAQGEAPTAAASIERALGETREPLRRARLLPAAIEIALAVDDVSGARGASSELDAVAADATSPMLAAVADSARGSVELAEGDPRAALLSLRLALRRWQELAAPYEAARTRVLLATACRAVGDEDAAGLELEAAEATFLELGAAPDVRRIGDLVGEQRRPDHGLTERELQVLRLVAAGRSNRQIASELVLSEHTVARHLQNIRTKLRVSSRTAAAAFAYEHNLV